MSEKKALPYKIGVLLVNFNQWELTHICVKSLLASMHVEVSIALIDNNSSSKTPDWVTDYPRVIFQKNDKNNGLTSGNNQAFKLLEKETDTDYVFILNNDTEVAEDTLYLLADYLANFPEVGITAPAIPYAEDPSIVWSAGGNYSKGRMVLKQLFKTVADLPEEPLEMEQVTGCAIMMRNNDYREAGMQDSDLFVYYEDTDLCFKVRKLGKKIFLIPKARVIHHVSISVGGIFSPFAVYFTHRNRFIVAKRYLPKTYLLIFFLYYTSVTFIKTAVYPLKGKSELIPWMWLAYKHGLQNRPSVKPLELFTLRSKA